MIDRNKILFLDIDGVFNTLSRSFDKNIRDDARKNSPSACKQLSRIITQTDCGIVFTSTWRTIPSYMNGVLPHEIEKQFKIKGIVERYLGETPDLNAEKFKGKTIAPFDPYYTKGEEIKLWLTKNDYHGKFAIIDDIDDEFDNFKEYLFITEMETGITKEIADSVINFLNNNEHLV